MTIEPPVRIENRAQLIHLLSEAAELEHAICCCYLFAAFSMKSSTEEGLSEQQLEAVQRWQRMILDIAIQEMLHLALVNNLLTSIGAAPYIRRPNLPTSPSVYPGTFELELRPFNEETMRNFVFLERPESVMNEDILASSRRPQPLKARDIFSDRPEYKTVGHLYRGIQDGFVYLNEKYGEENLFIGSKQSQIAAYPRLVGIVSVTNITTAKEAIQRIVEQGEGAQADVKTGHYALFVGIQKEYEAMKLADPSFEPGRPVMVNPYTHIPGDILDANKVNLVEDAGAVALCNLFDGAYEVLVQMLGRLFSHAEESDAEVKLLGDITVGFMTRIITPLAYMITRLPAGPSHEGLCAGPSFYLPRNMSTPPHKRAAWLLWRERMKELAAYCTILETYQDATPGLGRIGQTLSRFATRITDSGVI